MAKITKAVIAVAGSGTRFLPVTKTIPKEMLPIVDKPIIHLVVEELVEAGIEDIIMVTRWDKKPLEDYFDDHPALSYNVGGEAARARMGNLPDLAGKANFIYLRQKGPYGNGTPVLTAASLVGAQAFMYVWADDLVKSRISFAKQMVDDYEENGRMSIGVQEVPREAVDRYGIVKLRQGSMQIEDIIEKPSVAEAPSQLADFGRMILNQEIVDILRKVPLGKGNELWIVDAIRHYVRNGGVYFAKEVTDGEWITTGDPVNYLNAVLKYALDREDIREDVRMLIERFARDGKTR